VSRITAYFDRMAPESRVSRLRSAHSYRFVLLLILASFIFIALAPEADWTRSIVVFLQSATLVVALWTSGMRRYVRGSLILVVLAVIAAVGLLFNPGDAVLAAVGLFELVLALMIAATVALGIVDQGEVNTQSVTGAICVYLLLGLMFTFVYGAVAALGTAPLFAQGTDGTLSLRMYFSYTTLATVGYGDYTARGNLGHMLSITEALFGQLYLVTVVALLVSRMRPRSRTG
jgi:Ion channel